MHSCIFLDTGNSRMAVGPMCLHGIFVLPSMSTINSNVACGRHDTMSYPKKAFGNPMQQHGCFVSVRLFNI